MKYLREVEVKLSPKNERRLVRDVRAWKRSHEKNGIEWLQSELELFMSYWLKFKR